MVQYHHLVDEHVQILAVGQICCFDDFIKRTKGCVEIYWYISVTLPIIAHYLELDFVGETLPMDEGIYFFSFFEITFYLPQNFFTLHIHTPEII